MGSLLHLTQVIYSCWILGEEDDSSRKAIPTGPGVFDQALREMVDQGCFPEWLRQELHFIESSWGWTCLEATAIQKLATEAKITADPNPSCIRTDIKVTKPAAKHWLARLGIPEEEAKTWGKALRQAISSAEQQLQPSAA